MMLTDEKCLQLAREDYDRQESLREGLFGRFQFLVTAATLLIAANLSLVSSTPPGWRWWLIVGISVPGWLLLAQLFWLAWIMFRGNDYHDVKTIREYIAWRDQRADQLEESGQAESRRIADEESTVFLVEDYAEAADYNRGVNLRIQARLTEASRVVLWLTLATMIEACMYVILVAFGA
ncbi:MAG: hypothetical protein WD768_17330 [Phycisphaeraceae bacterium]